MQIYLNGKIIPLDQAAIPVNDRGLLLSDGIFTTLRCYAGKPFALRQHWARLTNDAKKLNLTLPLTERLCEQVIAQLLTANNLIDAIIRITVTRGSGPRGLTVATNSMSSVLVSCVPTEAPKSAPLHAHISRFIRNEYSPLIHCKTLAYTDNVMARHEAHQQGFDEAILKNTQGYVVCASAANIFIVKNCMLYTPSLGSGALPGIMRYSLMQRAKELNIVTHEITMTDAMLFEADEVFITNCVIGVRSIGKINGHVLATDGANFLTNQLSQKMQRLIKSHPPLNPP